MSEAKTLGPAARAANYRRQTGKASLTPKQRRRFEKKARAFHGKGGK